MTTELTREEVLGVLNEFLPLVGADERPQRQVRRGLRELGLPVRERSGGDPPPRRVSRPGGADPGDVAADSSRAAMIRPDAVLFNGGFFTPPIARERILDALASWFGERPAVLENDAPEAAVAIGAAFYAAIRRVRDGCVAAADSRRQRPGLLRRPSKSSEAPGITTAVCVMPRGTRKGHAWCSIASSPWWPTSRRHSRCSARPNGLSARRDSLRSRRGRRASARAARDGAPLRAALATGPAEGAVERASSRRSARSNSGANPRRRSTGGGCSSTCARGEREPLTA